MNAPTLTAIFLLGTLPLRAEDWPQWRGPERDGVWREDGIMETFPPEGLKILWRGEAGNGWSSPVVVDGRVFLVDSELMPPKARERVRCFDAASGKVLWTHAYDVTYPDWGFAADQNGGPTSTPAVADGKVYTLGAKCDAFCFAAATGEILWHRNLAGENEADAFQCRASPLIDGDRIVFTRGVVKPASGQRPGCIVALDRATGRELWNAVGEAVANATPAFITAGGQRQLIAWTGESVTSLNPATGAIFWREPMNTSNNDDNATPVWSGDRLLVSGLMFKLAADKPAATILWPENRGAAKRILSNTSAPVILGDTIYSVTSRGDFVALDAGTGQQLWRTDKVTARKTGPSAHITVHGDAVFVFTDEGNLIHARLSRTGYEEISRTKLIDGVYPFGGHKLTWTPPAYAHRCVFVRNEKEILCASLAAGGP